jgi:SulP family sulfate permease
MAEVPAGTRERAPASDPGARTPAGFLVIGRKGVKDAVAGAVASVVLVANIVSFAALMFPGDFGAGIPLAIWGMLVGSCVGGLWIGWTTSLPPISTGIDSPTGAFLVLLSASTANAVAAAGGGTDAVVATVMVVFTAATVVTGALLVLIGGLRWGAYFRFIPFFVIGGFLVATGWFLVQGGVRMTTGAEIGLSGAGSGWLPMGGERLSSAVAVLVILLALRRMSRSALAMPLALLAMWLAGMAILHVMGLGGPGQGWYLPSLGTLTSWRPLAAMGETHFSWPMVIRLVPEFFAVALVALMSLVTKVASLEVSRQTAGDLDREFRGHGIANLAIAPLGGIACSLQTGTSRLLEQAGGATRASGMVAAAVLGVVALTGLDLPGLVPIPLVAGLVFYLGTTFVVDATARAWGQRAWRELALMLLIALVCVRYGYLIGVVAGSIGACVLFAMNYARLGVVRRHATRATFASNVDRSAEASEHLRLHGDAIRIYWLSGYIFFGSSEGLFERVRSDIEARPGRRASHVILDFALVSGADSSALASLLKLRNFCNRENVRLAYSSLRRVRQKSLELRGLVAARGRHRAFADLNEALTWCEDDLMAAANVTDPMDVEGFEAWLSQQVGDARTANELMRYLERKDTHDSQVLYRQGAAADTIDLVAVGNLAIEIARPDAEPLVVRRFMKHTLVGEMGFVRRSVRSATVRSTGPATVFTLTRPGYERMRAERPDLAVAFDAFIMRTMADRVDQTNRAVTALGG